MELRLPSRIAVLLLVMLSCVRTARAGELDGPRGEFSSPILGRNILVAKGVFSPIEAEKQVLPYMKDQGHLFKGKAVLDIGTGTGIIGLYAAQLGARIVVATDINEAALSCTQLNAKRLGVDGVVETRWVGPKDIKAFSVIGPEESFDIIISNPPYTLDLDAAANTALYDQGDLGFSIVRGLQAHLSPGGMAILLYNTFFYHEVIARFARHLGYEVENFSPDYSTPWEQDILYNSYLKKIFEREKLDSQAFKFDWLKDQRSKAVDLFKLYPGLTMPKERGLYPGLIIIKHKEG